MSGTTKTTAALLVEQPDNNSAAILPQQMRNLTVSGPQWDVVSSSPAPGVLLGSVNVIDYLNRNGGVVGTGQTSGQRTTNGTTLQAAFDYAANNNKFLEFPPATIEINNASGIVCTTAAYSSFRYIGTMESNISQYAMGPVLTIGDATTNANGVDHSIWDGIQLYYLGAASTSTSVLVFGNAYSCQFKNFNMYGGSNAGNLIYSHTGPGSSAVFSCVFENFSGSNCTQSYLSFTGFNTGSVWKDIYFSNSDAPLVSPIIYGQSPYNNLTESVFDQLNVEHCVANSVINCQGGSATFVSPHFEQVMLSGSSPQFWCLLQSNTQINVLGGSSINVVYNNTEIPSGVGRYVYFYDNPGFQMMGHTFSINSPSLAQNAAFQFFYQDTGYGTPNNIARSQCSLRNVRFNQAYQGYMSLDGVMARATYGDIEWINGYEASGAFPRGTDVIINDPPTNMVIYGAIGRNIIVRYIAALTSNLTLVLGQFMTSTGVGSAVQRPFGDSIQVIREASATGSFSITVKNSTSGGTTVGTFSTSSAGTSQQFAYNAPSTGTWSAPAWATA